MMTITYVSQYGNTITAPVVGEVKFNECGVTFISSGHEYTIGYNNVICIKTEEVPQ